MASGKDVVVVGGGHNGLTAAAYLAAAGHRVIVLERRRVVGGAAVTEEFHPGYRNSTCSYLASLLQPKVIQDLDLVRHGLEFLPVTSRFIPNLDGSYLLLTGDAENDRREVAKFSKRDWEGKAALDAAIERAADLVRLFLLAAPSQALNGKFRLSDSVLGVKAAIAFLRMRMDVRHDTLRFLTSNIRQVVERHVESEPLRIHYYGAATAGSMAPLDQPGTAVSLLQMSIGETAGIRGGRAFVRGGMGSISEAMASAARERGAEIRTDCEVSRIIVESGRATGVALSSGEVIRADCVVSNCEPKRTFLQMIAPENLDPAFRADMAGWRTESGSFRMNLALRELPDFTCRPGTNQGTHHEAFISLMSSTDAIDLAYAKAKAGEWPDDPLIDIVIPSTKDDTLAPAGHHVASVNCQHFPYRLSGGRSWDDVRETVANSIVRAIARFAPNLPEAIVARQILTPLDLEREFGLTGGDVSHGKMDLDQISSFRPHAKWSDYRTPIKGLYLCGAGTHPGGGVTGAPGHNAAKAIIRDL